MNHIIYLNIIVAASTGILSMGITHRHGIDNAWMYGLFAFLSTMMVYNGQRLFKAESSIDTPWISWVRRNKLFLIVLTTICGLGAVVLLGFLQYNIMALPVLGISALISLFYVQRVQGKNMREIPYLKIHLIALIWTTVLLIFPLINEGKKEGLWIAALAHYLYVLAVTIPFDIRDLKYDGSFHRTIPQIVGVNSARIISLFLLVGFALLMFWTNLALAKNPAFYLAIFIQMALVLGMNERRSDAYCAGAIDGAISLLGVSYFL